MADMIKLTFPDGSVKEFEKGITTDAVAASISPGLRKKALVGKFNGELVDTKTPLNEYAA